MIEQVCSYSRLTLISAQPVPPLAELLITWALADPKIDERHVLIAAPEHDPPRPPTGPGSRSSRTRATCPVISTPNSPNAEPRLLRPSTAAIRHNRTIGQPLARSLTAYEH